MIILVQSVGWMTQVENGRKTGKPPCRAFRLLSTRETFFPGLRNTGCKHQTLDMYFVKIESCVKLHSCPAKAVPFSRHHVCTAIQFPVRRARSTWDHCLFPSARDSEKNVSAEKSPTRFRGICNINLHYGENQIPLLFCPRLFRFTSFFEYRDTMKPIGETWPDICGGREHVTA